MKRRTRNRLILVIGFLIALGIIITIISLIIAAIAGAASGGQTEVPNVKVIYDVSAAQTDSASSDTSSGTSSDTSSSE